MGGALPGDEAEVFGFLPASEDCRLSRTHGGGGMAPQTVESEGQGSQQVWERQEVRPGAQQQGAGEDRSAEPPAGLDSAVLMV